MPKAKYTLEGLEALRKDRPLDRNEYAAWWRFWNKANNTEAYQRWATHHKKLTSKWDENNREKRNNAQKDRYAKSKAVRDAKKAEYEASPEGVVAAQKRKLFLAQKRREYVANWRTKNPEKAKKVANKTRLKNREKRLAQTAAWREKNKNHVKEYQAAYDDKVRDTKCAARRAEYAADPESARAYAVQWRKDNPEQAARNSRAGKARRRAAKAAAGGTHTKAETDALFFTQSGRCANPYCCVEIDIRTAHLDHIYPLAPRPGGRQGSNGIDNLAWMCQPCNQRKTNLDPAEWARREAKRAGLF